MTEEPELQALVSSDDSTIQRRASKPVEIFDNIAVGGSDKDRIDELNTKVMRMTQMMDLLQQLSFQEEERGDSVEKRISHIEAEFVRILNKDSLDDELNKMQEAYQEARRDV